MITDKERRVIYDCITHWTVNIQSKFLDGIKAFAGMPPRWEDGSYLKCSVYSCPMCKEYLQKDMSCKRCLFITKLGKNCADSGGSEFIRKPTLKTCTDFMTNFAILLRS